MPTFQFVYETDRDEDDGYRVIEAENIQAAKDAFKAQMIAEGQRVVVHAIRGKA